MTGITEHLRDLRVRIDTAARRAGRNPAEIGLLAVSKGQPAAAIRAGLEAGLRDFGESYVQEALPKIAEIDDPRIRWHFTGTLQANKTRVVAERFSCVLTVTSARLAQRLSDGRPFHAGPLDVLLQLAPAGVHDRPGVYEDSILELAGTVGHLPRLRLRGLMLVPLPGLEPGTLASEYARAARVYGQMVAAGHSVDMLSLGMSEDLEAAVTAGSTQLRIGTALFGTRAGKDIG
ncbi:MAG: YggS family pyridoxal phosphate-dependent enzyme [Chromatiales bacterium]|nr:YggS family pyridoxal phosphate-dependent enzyme [Chromatiales bacterium]